MARISKRRLSAACLTAVTALVLAGCGAAAQSTASPIPGGGADASGASGTASGDGATDTETDTETDTSPADEPSGTEAPRTQAPDQPTASMAGLPIGDARPSSLSEAAQQCLSVRYLEGIPPGVRVAIVDAVFDPEVAKLGGAGCAGRGPACLDGFAFDHENIQDDARCLLPVTLTGTTTSNGDDQSLVTFQGKAVCPAGQESVCEKLHEDYAGDRSLGVGVPDKLIGTSSSDSSVSNGSGDSGTSSDSSQQPSTDSSGSPTES